MVIERHTDPKAYAELVLPRLLADEARFNLEIAVVTRVASGEAFGPHEPVLLTVDGAPVVRTPPHNVLVAALPPESAPAAAEWFAAESPDLPAALGGAEPVTAFAERYAALTGRGWRVTREQGVYELTELIPPRPVPGTLRQAADEDADLLLAWFEAFHVELDLPVHNLERQRARVTDGNYWVWDDGGPVSVAGCGGTTPHGARIGPVYTPPDKRGRGYASAVTAGATAALLGRGLRSTFLYTDLANPTSNKIYQAIGYRHVTDVREVRFGG